MRREDYSRDGSKAQAAKGARPVGNLNLDFPTVCYPAGRPLRRKDGILTVPPEERTTVRNADCLCAIPGELSLVD